MKKNYTLHQNSLVLILFFLQEIVVLKKLRL